MPEDALFSVHISWVSYCASSNYLKRNFPFTDVEESTSSFDKICAECFSGLLTEER